ncbi:MAG: hypothetical protein LWX07_07580 [Bacteroidetes bacterium]|nr:hypothetical protein [Bacteroidota bacterium]
MLYKILFPAVILLASATAFSCGSALYEPVPADARGNTSYKNLLKGRDIFINKCGNCHNLYIPEKHTAGEWSLWLDRMKNRAKISDAERDMIYEYLILRAKSSDIKSDEKPEKN